MGQDGTGGGGQRKGRRVRWDRASDGKRQERKKWRERSVGKGGDGGNRLMAG